MSTDDYESFSCKAITDTVLEENKHEYRGGDTLPDVYEVHHLDSLKVIIVLKLKCLKLAKCVSCACFVLFCLLSRNAIESRTFPLRKGEQSVDGDRIKRNVLGLGVLVSVYCKFYRRTALTLSWRLYAVEKQKQD